MSKNNSKQKVLDGALRLFYQKGFHATSVRDIAEQAGVNISIISYYFKSKQGLLEHLVVHYYEDYLINLQSAIEKHRDLEPLERLGEIVLSIIQYKHDHQKYSCFIHRELSMDSTFMREVFLTYIAKENYFLKKLFTELVDSISLNQIKKKFLFMQFKGMLAVPYTMQREFQQTLLHPSNDMNFVENYTDTIYLWMKNVIKSE